MTNGRLLLALMLGLVAATGCGSFEKDTGRTTREAKGRPRRDTLTAPAAGVPVEVTLDGAPLGTFPTDAKGDVLVDLASHARKWRGGDKHEVVFHVRPPDAEPITIRRALGVGGGARK